MRFHPIFVIGGDPETEADQIRKIGWNRNDETLLRTRLETERQHEKDSRCDGQRSIETYTLERG